MFTIPCGAIWREGSIYISRAAPHGTKGLDVDVSVETRALRKPLHEVLEQFRNQVLKLQLHCLTTQKKAESDLGSRSNSLRLPTHAKR